MFFELMFIDLFTDCKQQSACRDQDKSQVCPEIYLENKTGRYQQDADQLNCYYHIDKF